MPGLTLESCRRWASSNRLLLLLLAVCVVRLWLMFLTGSFWTDETGTVFVVRFPGDPSFAAAPQVPASIYYVLPRLADRLLGYSEISWRIPSLLLMAIAFLLIARLAARLIHPDAAWFAVFLCFAITDFNYYAVDARPYALGICVTSTAMFFLIRWLDTARWLPALLFCLSAAILWRVHLVFWAFYPVFLIYTILRLVRGTTRVGWPRAILVYCLIAIALVPVAFQALHILQTARAHVIVPVPGLRSLAHSIAWKPIAFCFGLVWLTARWFKWSPQKQEASDNRALILLWWLWMPLCLWAYSIATGTVLFIPRYFSPSLPGAALAATAAAAFYIPPARWKQLSAVLALVVLIWVGNWTVPVPHHSPDNWKDAAAAEHLLVRNPDTPVLVVSPFIEAQPPVWSPHYHLPGFLYAPLYVYPLAGQVQLLPFIISPATEPYMAALLRENLVHRQRFIVYGGGLRARSWFVWFSGRPELAGWSYTLHRNDDIETAVFEKHAQ